MIAERNSGVTVEGNLSGQSYQAGIDDENMEWVIGLFTDLYSDPQTAVIREYSTNAKDAQIEAGFTGPIQVTLPSGLSPFFKVADKGVGLSAEDIQRVYSRYGSSTKRGTNDQNGMLGMGCKSALAYCQQFTVESVKDGMRTVCSISREEGGVPIFTVIASVPDDGENGTEVIVPVQRHHHADFESKAAKFYRHWEPGEVEVNGKQPAILEGLDLGDGITLLKPEGYSYNRRPNLVVMGGVAYPVTEDELALNLPSNYYAVIKVPIGSVTFAPSREALTYNKQTRETLSSIPARVSKAVEAAVQKEVAKAKTPREALSSLFQWRDLVSGRTTASFKFKGRAIPEYVQGQFTLVPWSSRKLSENSFAGKGLNVEYISTALIVVGYDVTNFTATHKRKLEQFVDEHPTHSTNPPKWFVLCAQQPDMTWIDPAQVVQWADVKAIKLPTTSPVWRNGRPTGSYDSTIGGTFKHIQADEIDQTEAIYYCRALNRWEADRYAEIIHKFDPAATVIYLPENRYAKFVRNFPEAKTYTEGLQAAYDTWAKRMTKAERIALAMFDEGATGDLKALDPKRVTDPELRRACHVARNVNVQGVVQSRRSFNSVLYAISANTKDAEWANPLDRYPLIAHIGTSSLNQDHVYLYLNAAYEAAQASA